MVCRGAFTRAEYVSVNIGLDMYSLLCFPAGKSLGCMLVNPASRSESSFLYESNTFRWRRLTSRSKVAKSRMSKLGAAKPVAATSPCDQQPVDKRYIRPLARTYIMLPLQRAALRSARGVRTQVQRRNAGHSAGDAHHTSSGTESFGVCSTPGMDCDRARGCEGGND
jgi:hypothetical protein